MQMRDYSIAIVARWRIVVFSTAMAVLLCLAYLFLATPKYTATMTVMEVEQADSLQGGVGGIASSLSQLSVGGLTLGKGAGDTPFGQFRLMLTSVTLARQLDAKYGLIPVVFAGNWNEQSKTWQAPSGPMTWPGRLLRWMFGLPDWSPPQPADLAKYIQAHLDIVPDTSGQFLTLTFHDNDRMFAIRMLGILQREADDLIRQQLLKRDQANLSYLRDRFYATDNVGYREVFLVKLGELERQLMMLHNPQSFAAQVFDNISAPLTPSSPRPLLFIALSLVVGLLLGLAASIVHVNIFGDDYEPHWPGEFLLKRMAGSGGRGDGRKIRAT